MPDYNFVLLSAVLCKHTHNQSFWGISSWKLAIVNWKVQNQFLLVSSFSDDQRAERSILKQGFWVAMKVCNSAPKSGYWEKIITTQNGQYRFLSLAAKALESVPLRGLHFSSELTAADFIPNREGGRAVGSFYSYFQFCLIYSYKLLLVNVLQVGSREQFFKTLNTKNISL